MKYNKSLIVVLCVFFCVLTPLHGQMRVLVEPFTNTAHEDFDWLASGMEASILSDLAQVPGVSVFSSEDRRRALEELAWQLSGAVDESLIIKAGNALGANIILSGEYAVIGEELRITARLAMVETATVISSVKRDGTVPGIFSLQDELIPALLTGIDEKKSGGLKKISVDQRSLKREERDFDRYQYHSRELALIESVPQEFLDIEAGILEILNRERNTSGMPLLKKSPKLSALARYHSTNMQVYNFFGFLDQNGMGSQGRRLMLSPELFGPSGELIAWTDEGDAAAAIKSLASQCLSEEVRSQILDPAINYCGIGIYRGDGPDHRYFCTVIPAALMAELVTRIPARVPYGSEQAFVFRFIGSYPRERVGIVVRFPDRSARFPLGNARYVEGFGLYKPSNWRGDFFTVRVSCDRGRGAYVLQCADGDNFYPFGLTFISR